MTARRAVIICLCYSFFSSGRVWGKTLTPLDFNQCIYSYWGGRVNGGVIDAQAALDTAKANLYPSITGSAVYQNDLLAQPNTGFYLGAYITLNQQLINISQWANIHAKNISEKASQLDFEDQMLTLMKVAIKTYFEYLQSAKRLKLLEKRIDRLDKAVTLAKELSRLHLSDPSSVFLAQADKAGLDISITNAQAESAASLNLLQASIGLGKGFLELEDSYSPQVSNDLSYWSKRIDELPGIEVLKAKAEAAGAAATAARDQRIPALSLGTYYGQVPASVGINPGGGSALVVFTLGFPVFDQGLISIQAQQQESQKALNEAQIASKREQLLAEIKNLLIQLQADEKVWNLAKIQLENAQKGYKAVSTLFSLGKSTFIAVKNSEVSLIDSEIQIEAIQKKIAGEKTTLELLGEYSAGKYRPKAGDVKCPVR